MHSAMAPMDHCGTPSRGGSTVAMSVRRIRYGFAARGGGVKHGTHRGQTPPPGIALFQHTNKRQISEAALKIESVSDDEIVRDIEPCEIHGNIGGSRALFPQQDACPEGQRTARLHSAENGGECGTGVQDVIDHKDMTSLKPRRQCMAKHHPAAGSFLSGITFDCQRFNACGK